MPLDQQIERSGPAVRRHFDEGRVAEIPEPVIDDHLGLAADYGHIPF